MPDIPRLNGVIKALEQGQTAFVAFTPVDVESAVAMASSKLDGVAFEMEHAPSIFPGCASPPSSCSTAASLSIQPRWRRQ